MKYFRSCSLAVVILSLLTNGCFRKSDYVPISKQSLNRSGKLYLVPLGEFSKLVAEELASYYKTKYGISAETLPTVYIPPSARNAERQQLIAEEAVDLMRRVNSEISGNPNAILIGLTTEDMYISQYDWRFSFSWREQGKYAVVSSGRMNLGNVSEDETRKRFRKMVTKNVGILYFHLPQSDDPRSVLYRNVGGIRELDYMGEEF